MPLDPQARDVLATLPVENLPDLSTVPPELVRKWFREMGRPQGAGPALARIEDREIPGPSGPLGVRIYTPEGRSPWK